MALPPTFGLFAANVPAHTPDPTLSDPRMKQPPFPELRTSRLWLRELNGADVDALYAIHADAQAMCWSGADAMCQRYEAEHLIATYQHWRRLDPPGTRWAVVRLEDRCLLGTCGLFGWNPPWRCAIVGYELGRHYWGQGYMTEALHAVLRWGAQAMTLHRVEAHVHAQNTASWRLLARLGFHLEGTAREAGFWNHRYHDLQRWGLLLSELSQPRG